MLAKPLSKIAKLWQLSRMDLVQPYHEYFALRLADTDELRKEVFKLRYDVYCSDLGWESASDFPDKLEKDVYDDVSRHCLLLHRSSGQYAGTVRMVLTEDSTHDPLIPLVSHCHGNLYDGPLRPDRQAPGSYGEISRLALRQAFRRRAGENTCADATSDQMFEWSQDERRRFPHIALGLYLGASAVGLAEGVGGVYAMMEPRLARHLRFAGIRFEQVGDTIELRGKRAPYYISRKALFRYLSSPLRKLLHAVAKDLRLQL